MISFVFPGVMFGVDEYHSFEFSTRRYNLADVRMYELQTLHSWGLKQCIQVLRSLHCGKNIKLRYFSKITGS